MKFLRFLIWIILLTPIILCGLSIVFVSCVNSLFTPEEAINDILIGTELPKSATEVDYFYTAGIDGISGSICARISKEDFLEIIQSLQVESDLKKKKELSKDDEDRRFIAMLDNPDLPTRALSCWASTNPNNEETYLLSIEERKLYIAIRYEKGKIFVIRSNF